jgi:hypothetical protein
VERINIKKRRDRQEPMKLCTQKINLCLAIQLNAPSIFIEEFGSIVPNARLNQIENEIEIEIEGSDLVGLEPSDWAVIIDNETGRSVSYIGDQEFKDTYRLIGNATRKDKGHDECV